MWEPISSRTFAPFLQQLIADGYRVSLVYVWLNSPDLSVSRVAARYRSGGHIVDEEIVRRRYARSLHNFFALYQPLADEWQVHDNSGEGRARLIGEGRHTDVVTMYDQAVWEQMLRRAGREH